MKWLRALIVAALCLAPVGAGAWWQSIQQVAVSTGITFSFAWVSHAEDSAGGTAVNYGTLSFGVADPNRIIAVTLCNRGSVTAATVASMLIGGISATQVSGALADTGAITLWACDMWQAAVPIGTTGNVTVTYSNSSSRSGIDLYRIVTGTPTRSAVAIAQNFSGPAGGSLTTPSITVPTGGAMACIYGNRGPGVAADITWPNPPTKDNTAIQIATFSTVGSASSSVAGSTTVTASISGSSATAAIALSCAAWGQ